MTAAASANPHFLVLILSPAILLQQQKCQSLRKCQGRHEKESASKKGPGVEAILQNKVRPEFWMLLLTTDCASRLLIIHIILWFNIGIYYREYYVHYMQGVFSVYF